MRVLPALQPAGNVEARMSTQAQSAQGYWVIAQGF